MYGNGEGVRVRFRRERSTSVVSSLVIHSWLYPKASELKSAAPGTNVHRAISCHTDAGFILVRSDNTSAI